MSLQFPGESPEYRAARETLLEQEIALRRQMEAVAAARRALPLGGRVPEDYVFEEWKDGRASPIKLSELFTPGRPSLLVYNMMFPRSPSDTRAGVMGGETARLPLAEMPCPSCTALLDQLDGAVEHVTQKVAFVIIAKAPIARVVTFAKERGWSRLRFVSSRANKFKRDYHAEDESGAQMPMLNVFSRDADGKIRHFWSSELLFAPTDPDQDPRHVGTVEPMWNLFDMTREGRQMDWDEQLQYPSQEGAPAHCEHCK